MSNSIQKIPRHPIRVPRKIAVPTNRKKQDDRVFYICVITIVIFLLSLLLLFLSCTSRPIAQSEPQGLDLPANNSSGSGGSGTGDGTGDGTRVGNSTDDSEEEQEGVEDVDSGEGTDSDTTSPHALQGDKNNTQNKEATDENSTKNTQPPSTNIKTIEPDQKTKGEKLADHLNQEPSTTITTKFDLEENTTTLRVFRTTGKGSSFVFVFDRSGSMIGRPLHNAKLELIQALASLKERHRFNIIFYDDEKVLFNKSTPLLITATKKNKQNALKFIDGIEAGGGTKPLSSLLSAISSRPDVIFFLTDGAFALNLDDVCQKAGKTKINVIQFGSGSAQSSLLQELAERTNGDYSYIDIGQLDQ
ncbi:MAG: VWA domain-containing protein, partial [Planctomycetaceae bacterium]|nr:VWA domain-containing protein [Planctomycetaceae bacterium]